MPIVFEKIIYLLSNIFYIYLVSEFVKCFHKDTSYNRKMVWATSFVYFFALSAIYFLVNIPILNLLTNVAFIGLIAHLFEGSFKSKMLTTFLFISISVLAELLAGFLLSYIYNAYYLNSANMILSVNLISKILLYIFIRVLKAANVHKEQEEVPIPYWLAILIIPLSTVIILITISQLSSEFSNSFLSALISLSIFCLFVINVLVFYLYDKLLNDLKVRTDNLILSQQLEYYDKEFKHANARQEEINRLAHDIKNHLISISGLASSETLPELKSYISSLQQDFNYEQTTAITDNATIDAILNYKLYVAKSKDIQMGLDVTIPSDVKLDAKDMCVLIGNLLDNSIEACEYLTPKDRKIFVTLKYKNGNVLLSIRNSCNSKLVKNHNGVFYSIKDDKANHGYGLKNIQNIVDKYDGDLEIANKDDIFAVSIILYNVV